MPEEFTRKDRKMAEYILDRDLAVFDELNEMNDQLEQVNEIFGGLDISKIEIMKGEKGDDGKSIIGPPGPPGGMGPMPIAGKDYPIPKNGEHGYTPRKNIDYFDGLDGESIEGPPGPQGPMGPKPKHEWNGSQLRFENPDGSWGKFADLMGPQGGGSFGGWFGGGGGGSSLAVRNNGTLVSTAAQTLNFTGSGVSITRVGESLNVAISGGGSVAIGSAVTSGTPKSLLFIDASGFLAQDNANISWDYTNLQLQVGAATVLEGSTVNSFVVGGSSTSYFATYIQNLSNGTSASTDVTGGNDTDNGSISTGKYFDVGINSSTYNDASFTFGAANDTYFYGVGGNVAIGSPTANKSVKFFTGGFLAANVRATIADASISTNVPLLFASGVAVTAASYYMGRDADATNQMHFNVPTGAGWEWSVNDVAFLTMNINAITFPTNGTHTAASVQISRLSSSLSFNVGNTNSHFFRVNNVVHATFSATGLTLTPLASAAGATTFSITPAAHTALTAEVIDTTQVAHTVTLADGTTIALSRSVVFGATTFNGVAAGGTEIVTTAINAEFGLPVQGTNLTFTNAPITARFLGNVVMGNILTPAAGPTNTFFVASGTAPTAVATDSIAMYSADVAAGNAAPFFMTENGSVIKLFKSSAYTPTNVTTDRAYDANATTVDEVADVLGTLIADLQATGLIG